MEYWQQGFEYQDSFVALTVVHVGEAGCVVAHEVQTLLGDDFLVALVILSAVGTAYIVFVWLAAVEKVTATAHAYQTGMADEIFERDSNYFGENDDHAT